MGPWSSPRQASERGEDSPVGGRTRWAMLKLTAKRTLVKSQPELWEELSEVQRLAKHLGAFGEIKITRLDLEHTVVWEGEHASGTVSIEPSGWGTKVTLSAELAATGGLPEAEEPVPKAGDQVTETEEPAVAAVEPPGEAVEPAAAVVEPPAEAVEPADPPEGPVPHADDPVAYADDTLAHDEEPFAPVATLEPAEPAPQPTAGRAPGRRRGFWARLFSGWLVPEKRLNRAHTAWRWEDFLGSTPAATEEAAEKTAPTTPATLAEEPGAEEAEVEVEAAASEPVGEEPAAEPEPTAAEPEPTGAEPETTAVEPSEEHPDEQPPGAIDHERAQSVLVATLDALGSAHHRPYSRG